MGKKINKKESKIKFTKCKRCGNKMLKQITPREGLVSYCYYCNGFFNEEGDFIEEGSAYFDARYRKGYWSWALLVALTGMFVTDILYNVFPGPLYAPWWVYSGGVGIFVGTYSVVSYFKLKKKTLF